METHEKFRTFADVFDELPRNVQYNLRTAVCKTLNVKPSDFYRLLAYPYDETTAYKRGTFFYLFDGFYKNLPKLAEISKGYQTLGINKNPSNTRIVNERQYLVQARNEAVIKNEPAPELYVETYLKPYWNATKTVKVTRHGVTHTQCPRPLNKSGRAVVNSFDGRVMSGASIFFPNKKRSMQIYTAV